MKSLELHPGALTNTPRSGPGQGERWVPKGNHVAGSDSHLGIIGCHARAVRGVDPEARGEEDAYFKPSQWWASMSQAAAQLTTWRAPLRSNPRPQNQAQFTRDLFATRSRKWGTHGGQILAPWPVGWGLAFGRNPGRLAKKKSPPRGSIGCRHKARQSIVGENFSPIEFLHRSGIDFEGEFVQLALGDVAAGFEDVEVHALGARRCGERALIGVKGQV